MNALTKFPPIWNDFDPDDAFYSEIAHHCGMESIDELSLEDRTTIYQVRNAACREFERSGKIKMSPYSALVPSVTWCVVMDRLYKGGHHG